MTCVKCGVELVAGRTIPLSDKRTQGVKRVRYCLQCRTRCVKCDSLLIVGKNWLQKSCRYECLSCREKRCNRCNQVVISGENMPKFARAIFRCNDCRAYCYTCDVRLEAGINCTAKGTHCKPCRKLYLQEYHRNHPEKVYESWENSNRRRFSVTKKELTAHQDARCAICGIVESALTKSLHLDHDHTTGKARGMLCGKCNTGVGLFEDNPALLHKAIEYLKNPPAQKVVDSLQILKTTKGRLSVVGKNPFSFAEISEKPPTEAVVSID